MAKSDDELPSAQSLLQRVQQGDQEAAALLYQQHVGRLIRLAQQRISPQLGRRLDAEDVVQSALSSFFRGAGEGAYTVSENGDLWPLLAAITMNKVRQKVEHHSTAKRNFRKAVSPETSSGTAFDFLASEPGPDAALEVLEEMERITSGMDEIQRQMVDYRIQAYEFTEIAELVSRSERTVRRVLTKVKDRLRARIEELREDGV